MFNSSHLIKWILPAAVLAYVLIYFLFFPVIYAYRDEANYLSMAYALRSGHLFVPIPDIPMQAFIYEGGKAIPVYPLMHSVLLLPFIGIGWKTVFLIGLFGHLAGVFFVRKLARYFSIDPLLPSLLYLFYPPFVLYSRTIMTDVPSTVIFMAAAYFYYRPKTSKIIPGLLFGLALVLRTSNLLLVIPFGLTMLFQAGRSKNIRDLALFCAGIIPFVLFQMTINSVYYGNPLASGYNQGFPLGDQFAVKYFKTNAIHYLTNLLICYPLMLPLFFNSKMRRVAEINMLVPFLIVFFSFYYFHDAFPGILLERVMGNRFLFPIIPFLLLGYSSQLDTVFSKFPRFQASFILFLCAGLICSAALISWGHLKALTRQNDMRELIYKKTPENSIVIYDDNSAELLQSVWGKRTYLPYPDFDESVTHLDKDDYERGVYFIKRDFHYADKGLIPGASEETLPRDLELQSLAQKGEVTVYAVTPRKVFS